MTCPTEVTVTKGYIVECSTGCTCCSNENHLRGPFSSREVAEAACVQYHNMAILASQYARNGNYYVREYDAESLPDGRIIVGSIVFPQWKDDSIGEGDQIFLEISL